MKTYKIVAAALAFLISISSAHASTSKVYTLKGDAPSGTRIPSVLAKSPVPFNKRFVAFSPAEQEIFKSKFKNIGSADTPPFPRSGLRGIYNPLIKASQKLNVNGSLHLIAKVNANGFVESVSVLETPNVNFAAVAESILLKTRFDPATCSGAACEMSFPLEITFK